MESHGLSSLGGGGGDSRVDPLTNVLLATCCREQVKGTQDLCAGRGRFLGDDKWVGELKRHSNNPGIYGGAANARGKQTLRPWGCASNQGVRARAPLLQPTRPELRPPQLPRALETQLELQTEDRSRNVLHTRGKTPRTHQKGAKTPPARLAHRPPADDLEENSRGPSWKGVAGLFGVHGICSPRSVDACEKHSIGWESTGRELQDPAPSPADTKVQVCASSPLNCSVFAGHPRNACIL